MKFYYVRVMGVIKERLTDVDKNTLQRLARQYGRHMVLQSVICL